MLISLTASAENVKGTVKDAQGKPIPFATVSVLSSDSTLLTGAITDDDGHYSIEVPARTYIIQASYVGFKTAFGGPDFVLCEETEQLAEVEVKAKKPLIERQMDKLVVNVSASPLAAGSNGNDILRRAPGVRIDKDGNITVNGKSVEIWVDGKPSYLSGQQLKAMLDGTDGNTIEKIEIISNPSAKYDASGQGGIINIKTKRNMMKGLNGMLSAGYGGMYFGDVKRWLSQEIHTSVARRQHSVQTFHHIALGLDIDDTALSGRIVFGTRVGDDLDLLNRVSVRSIKHGLQLLSAEVRWFAVNVYLNGLAIDGDISVLVDTHTRRTA